MTKKIEGWIEIGRDRCPVVVQEYSRSRTDHPTTVVVHEGEKYERVFTESEVKALLLSIDAAIMQDRAQMAIMHEAKKRGIILDPA